MIRKALGHLISCNEATRLVSRGEDARLSFLQRSLLRLHLAVCDACARFGQQIRLLRLAMQKYRE